MKLCQPSVEFKDTFQAMQLDYQKHYESKYQIEHIELSGVFENYITRLQDRATGINLKPGFV